MAIVQSHRSWLRLPIFFSTLALIALLLVGCGNRRAAATAETTNTANTNTATTAASPPAPAATPNPAANETAPATRAAAPAPSSTPVAQSNSLVPRQRATVEPFAPASPLQQAVWFHHVGDYSQEQRLLRTLLADPQITLTQRQEARYQLALSYLADEQPTSAANVLDQFSLQAGSLSADDPLRSRTVFLRAEALARVGRNAEAVAAYEAFLQQHPQVTSAVEERIADAWLAAADWPQAANALRRAANHAANNWEKVRLLDRLAGTLEGHGRWSQAASVYDEILVSTETQTQARNRDEAEFDSILGYRVWNVHRVGYLYRAGIAYSTAGDEEAAIARWRLALDEEPDSNAAYQSLIQLVNRNVPVDLFVRGQIDLFAKPTSLPSTPMKASCRKRRRMTAPGRPGWGLGAPIWGWDSGTRPSAP